MTGEGLVADPWGAATEAAAALAARTGVAVHDVAVVLGSGWAAAAAGLGEVVAELPATDLGAPPSTVPGHEGVVRSVSRDGLRVLTFAGRAHPYEGHDLAVVVHPVRVAARAGCRAVVLTNAAGGIDATHRVGQVVVISDHLNLTGRSPLAGPPPPEGWAGRFVDLTDCYDPSWRSRLPADLVAGVYAGLPGPHYETPAEIRMLRTLGADLVGMSTVHEAIAARHAGLAVLGLSLVTNAAAGMAEPLDHAEVVAAGRSATAELERVLAAAVDAVP